jgi:transposase
MLNYIYYEANVSNRKYDEEFKLKALEMYHNGKRGMEVCKALGIPDSTFWNWIRKLELEKEEIRRSNPSSEDACLLKKELEEVKMERDILKKALAIFSKQR